MKSRPLEGKRLLMLGGLRTQVPVIKKAQELGCYVISGDIYPDNYSHKFSDEYRYINVIDKKLVLEAAKELKVNGITSFAVDVGVPVAAYVCEKLGLPYVGSYKSVNVLQNKHLFREFLAKHNFNTPFMFMSKNYEEALERISDLTLPIIVKPVDSAGSKGVTRVNDIRLLNQAFELALKYSISKQVIIEEFIEPLYHPSDSDCFSLNGDLVYFSMSNQHFDEQSPNPYTPAGYQWPSSHPKDKQNELQNEMQRLLKLLDMKSGLYNVETRIGNDNMAYIMECSPRGGGNRISEILSLKTGVDYIENSIFVAIGMDDLVDLKGNNSDDYWGELILHSNQTGIYKELFIDESIKQHIVEIDLWVQPGDEVKAFEMANTTIGTVILKSSDRQDIEKIVENDDEYIRVELA